MIGNKNLPLNSIINTNLKYELKINLYEFPAENKYTGKYFGNEL